jgi:hypothetical protein
MAASSLPVLSAVLEIVVVHISVGKPHIRHIKR